MAIKELKFQSQEEFLNHMSQLDTSETVLILPHLDSKKRFVLELTKSLKTVPDRMITRLSEFFSNQVLELKPDIEFFDKSLLLLYLKDRMSSELKKNHTQSHFVELAIEYISVFGPLLGNKSYRSIFEEYIETDEFFKSNYKEIYPFITKVWDEVISSDYLVRQWSLGWLYQHLEALKKRKKTIIIYNIESLKTVEYDFFEELSFYWEICSVKIEAEKIHSDKKLMSKLSFLSPYEEIQFLKSQMSDKDLDSENVIFVVPQKGKEYLEIMDIFFLDKSWTSEIETPKNNIFKIREEFDQLLIQESADVENNKTIQDFTQIFSKYKKAFSNYNSLKKTTQNLFNLEELNSDLKTDMSLSSFKKNVEMDYYTFSKVISDLNLEVKDDFLEISKRKVDSSFLELIYSQVKLIPSNLKLKSSYWFEYLEKLIEQKFKNYQAQSVFRHRLIDEVEFLEGKKYFILGCTQQNYEKSDFTYLTSFEVDKLKLDLGFNLEGMNNSEKIFKIFNEALKSENNLEIHFLTTEYNFSGQKENEPKFLKNLEKEFSLKFKDISDDKKINLESQFKNPLLRNSQPQLRKPSLSSCELNSGEKNSGRPYQSVSSVQKYIKCPFIYFSEYVLKQKAEDPIDYSPASLFTGNVLHKILEDFLDQANITEERIYEEIILKVDAQYPLWKDKTVIQEQLKSYAKKIKTYILEDIKIKETENRKTLFKELEFICYFDLEDLKFYKDDKLKRVKFKGKIDRVDAIDDQAYLFDYKLSKSLSYESWIKERNLQMPIYGLMMRDQILPIDKNLSQLSYIVINDSSYKIGFGVKHKETSLNLKMWMTKANSVENEKMLFENLEDFALLLKESLVNISEGKFSPAPLDTKVCQSCHWRMSCQAKHLN